MKPELPFQTEITLGRRPPDGHGGPTRKIGILVRQPEDTVEIFAEGLTSSRWLPPMTVSELRLFAELALGVVSLFGDDDEQERLRTISDWLKKQ